MTDDASPKNLRKFLKSKDPARVRMGLSMAKGAGVPDELLPTILKLYMWDDDKSVRAAAKSVFTKYAPAKIQAKVKENWKPSYRTLDRHGGKFLKVIPPLLKSQDDIALSVVYYLLKVHNVEGVRQSARYSSGWTGIFGKLGAMDKRKMKIVPLLIEALDDKSAEIRFKAISALKCTTVDNWNTIVNKRVVEPLVKALEDESVKVRYIAADTLGFCKNGAVEPLIKALGDESQKVRAVAAGSLGSWIRSDKRAVEPLIEALEDKSEEVRKEVVSALGRIRDKRAVVPLIKALEDKRKVRSSAVWALGNIGDARAVEPLIKSGNIHTLKFQFGILGLITIADAGKGDELTVDELKQVLKKKKLSTSGTKKVLVRRLSYQDHPHTKLELEMAKDASPKNLSKLLESKDPSLIRMGLSMAKDSKAPDMLGEILWLRLLHEESEIRTAAKSTFTELAPEEVRLIVKDNWRANYRTTKSKIGNNLYQLETKLKSVDFTIFERLIKALDDEEYSVHASRALGLLKDERAVEPLIRIFKNKKALEKAGAAARGLGKIGNKQAVNTLFRALYGHKKYQPLDEHIAEALGEIGDFRVVKPCVKEIEAAAFSERKEMSKSLLFNVLDSTNFSELKPEEIDEKLDALIILLHYEDAETKGEYRVRGSSGNYYTVTEYDCTCTGYEFRNRCKHIDTVRTGATEIKPELTSRSKTALKKIVETNVKEKERKNILKFLKSDDPAMVMMGASMLKGILEK